MASIEWLYNNFKSRFPDGRPDQYLNLIKRNFPERYNEAKRHMERLAKQIEEAVDKTTEKPKQSTKKVPTSNTTINKDLDTLYGNQDNKPNLNDIKQKVGGGTKSTPKAGGLLKGIGGKAVPTIGIGLEIPSYWKNVTNENADWKSRTLDTLGLLGKGASLLAGATGVGTIPAGSIVPIKVANVMGSQISKNGDQFIAKTPEHFITKDKYILIYKGTDVKGQVCQAKPGRLFVRNGVLTLSTDTIVTPNDQAVVEHGTADVTVKKNKFMAWIRKIFKGEKIIVLPDGTVYVKLLDTIKVDLTNGWIFE